MEDEQFSLAKTSLLSQPNSFYFQGSAYDYARAAMYYKVITKKTSISKLMSIYNLMLSGKSFPMSVEDKLGWSAKKWNQEVKNMVARH